MISKTFEKYSLENLVEEFNLPKQVIIEMFSKEKIYNPELGIPDYSNQFILYIPRNATNFDLRINVYHRVREIILNLSDEEKRSLRTAIAAIRARGREKMKRFAMRAELSRFEDFQEYLGRVVDLGKCNEDIITVCIDNCKVFETGESVLYTADSHMWITINRNYMPTPKVGEWLHFEAKPYVYGSGSVRSHKWSLGFIGNNWKANPVQFVIDWWRHIKHQKHLNAQYA